MKCPLACTLALVLVTGLAGCDDPNPEPEPAVTPETTVADDEGDVPPGVTKNTEPDRHPAVGEETERAAAFTVEQARQVRAHLARARAANRRGELDAALEAYRAAAAIDADGRALCEMGWVLFQSEERDEAREALTRGLASLPTSDPVPEAFVGPVGSCLYNMGRLEEEAGNATLARQHYTRSLAVRPGNRVVQARLDALPTQEADAVVGGMPTCAEGARPFALDAWTTRVRALAGARSVFVQPLVEVGLNLPEASAFVDIEGRGDGDESPLGATVTEIPLSLGNERGVALHVSLDDHMGGQFDGLAVLRRSDESNYCVLGAVEEAVDACSTSCLSDDPVFEVRTTHLVSEDRDALRVATRTGACSCGSHRGARHELAFFGVEGDALRTYLEVVTYNGWYHSPWPPTHEVSAEVTIGTEYPRSLSVVEREECEPCGEELLARMEEAEGDELASLESELFDDCGEVLQTECTPGETRRTLVYRNGEYAP